MRQITTRFYGQCLRIAREFRLLTQSELAQKTSASAALISLCEADKNKRPSRDLVEAWGAVLGFQPEFFYAPLEDVFQEEECNFRHRGTTPKRIKAQVRAHATLVGLVIRTLRSRRLFPPVDVPRVPVSTRQNIEMAAEQCRRYWKLGLDGPVQQLQDVLEAAGVIVANHVVRSKQVDTFSRYRSGMAVIFPNQEIQTSSVLDFDMAHELGHMVMHHGIPAGTKEAEQEADVFASDFLMPSGAFGREFQALPFSWGHVFRLQKRWNVSAAAIAKGAYELKLLGAVEYRAASKYIYMKGWNKRQPHESRPQKLGLFEKVLDGLGQKETLTIDLPIETLCEQLYFTPNTFYDVTRIAIPPRNMAPSSDMGKPLVSVPSSSPGQAVLRAGTPVPEPSSDSVAQVPEPYGLDSIRSGTKEIFLLRSVANCELARHCDQKDRVVSVEIWHPQYMDLPVFKAVELVWLVINRSDEREANIRFLQSIADDSSIRGRSRVATVNSQDDMISLFKWVLQRQRSLAFSAHTFEYVFKFKPCPLQSDTLEINELTEPPPPFESRPTDPIFRR